MTKNTYSIGAVSRTLGISTHALRKWEERHNAIRPARSAGGDRRYSSDDLERLSRLKALVELGHPIGELAELSNDDLDRLRQDIPGHASPERRRIRVAVIGQRIAHELQQTLTPESNIEVVVTAESAEELRRCSVDTIITELGYLGDETRSELAKIRAGTGVDCIVIVYGYGSIAVAEQLSDATTALVRRPLVHREFARTLAALVGHAGAAAQPPLALKPHRFSRDLLIRMAMISPELACECPRHVGQLLIELTDFESYSAECENTKPQDAAIHNMLRRTASTSRALFERALMKLAEAEGIDLDDPASEPRLLAGD